MFTIIAGVIGLGIAVALLIVGANYLGNAYTNSTAKAQATSLANLGQQVQGAVQLAIVEKGSAPTVLTTVVGTGTPAAPQTRGLTPDYLASVPVFQFATVSDSISGGILTATGVSDKLCEQVALIGGVNVTTTALGASDKFGCIEASAGVRSFAYKVN